MKKMKRILSMVIAVCVVMTGLVVYTQPDVFAGDYVQVQIANAASSVDRATTSTITFDLITTKKTSSDIVWSNRGSISCNGSSGTVLFKNETTNANQYNYSIDVSSWSNGNYTITGTATVRHKTYSAITDTTTATHTFTVTCSHTGYTSTVSTVSPTCTEAGYTNYKCTKCSATWTGNSTAALGHDYTSTSTAISHLKTAADCENAAVYYYSCTRCGANGASTFTSGEALGHLWDSGTVTTAATCTEDGVKTYTCTRDGSHTYTETITAIGHDWGEGTVVTPATCTTNGTMSYTCQNDPSHTKTETITATGHNWVAGTVVPPTCTAEGYTIYTCSICGENKMDDNVDALGGEHNFDTTSPLGSNDSMVQTEAYLRSEANCTDASTYYYKCTRCTASSTVDQGQYYEYGSALGHDWDSGTVVPPTCLDTGYTEYTCTRCGFTYRDNETAATGHSWDEGTVTTAATCTDAGVMHYVCENDASHTNDVSIPPLGHDWDEGTVTTQPTCTGTGITTYTCQNDNSHTRTEPIEALGHIWDEGTVTTAPGCTTDGVKTYTCTRDPSHTRTEEISALTHDFSVEDPTEDYFRSAATCTDAATYYYKCSRCGESSEGNTNSYFSYGDSLGHDYEAFIIAPTCTEAGYTRHVCSRCGDTYVDTPVAALGHDYTSTSTAISHLKTAADCENAAVYYYSCTRCGVNSTDTFTSGDPLGHDWDEGTETLAATCTTAGTMHYVCSRDASHTKDEEIAALGHLWDEGTVTTAATCEGTGTMHYVCTRDGSHTKDEEIAALGHIWDEGTVTTQPTCTDAGVRTYTCTRDNSHTYTSAIAALGHDWDEGVVTQPTCTDAGYTTYTCSRCGATYNANSVAALGHNWDEGVVTDPTCTEDGYTTFTCSRCGATRVESVVDALGHNFTSQVQTEDYYRGPQTCTEALSYYYKCSRCAESSEGYTNTYYYVGSPLGHSWGPGVVTTEPTCDETGIRTYTCTNDSSHTRTEVVQALGHDWDAGTITTQPTCTETGIRTFTCQNDANHTYTGVEPALGHSWDAGVITAPTCTEGGYTTYTCTRCDETKIEDEVEALGHNYEFTRTVDPTCTEDGYDIYTCSRCGGTENRNVVAALGHDYVATVTPPTCTEAGYTTHTCSRCGDSYTDTPVAATGHSYVDTVVAPTCTEAGYTTHTCSVCDDTYDDTPVAALGHDFTSQVQSDDYLKTAATCTDPATYYYKCSRCAESSEGDTDTYYSFGDALGHDYVATVTAPTCTEDGYTTHTCSRCGDSYTDTPVDALGHDIEGVDWEVVTAATTLADGLKVKRCKRCGTVIQSEVIPMIVNPTAIDVTPAQNIVSVGSTAQLSVVYTPANSNVLELTWASSDPTIATVNSSGLVTGVAEGAVMITATLVSDGTIYDSASVTVVPTSSTDTTDIADSSSDLVVNVGADTTTVTAIGNSCNTVADGTNSFDFTISLSLSETYINTPVEEGSIVAVITLDNNYASPNGYSGLVGSTVYPSVSDSVFIPLVEGNNTFTIVSPSYIEPDQDGNVLWHVSVYLGGTSKAPKNTLLYSSVVEFDNDETSDAMLAVSASGDPLLVQADTAKNINISYSNISSLKVSVEAQNPSTGEYSAVAALTDVSVTLAGSGQNYPITIGVGNYEPGTTLRLTFTGYDSSNNAVATDKCYLVVSWIN